MTHFGIICPPGVGHLNAMMAIGQALQRRGHRVTMFNVLDTQEHVLAGGIEFCAIATDEFPLGKMRELRQQLGNKSGISALKGMIELIHTTIRATLQEHERIQAAGVDALLVDQARADGGAIADSLGIPFITICNALLFNQEPNIPPIFTTWGYQPVFWARWRNQLINIILKLFSIPAWKTLQAYRQQWNLPPYSNWNEVQSPLAVISQQPAAFEFPRKQLPSNLYFTGPFVSSTARANAEFPFEQLSDRPLIYASLGTIQNRLVPVFQIIAAACADLDVQLVLSLGGSLTPAELGSLPGSPIVVQYAPQLALLQRASLCITHAGLNTTLECLSAGVPMVAIPITNDQPGNAARIAWTGTGEFLTLKQIGVERLRLVINQVLSNPSYKQRALELQAAIHQANGVEKAADIIEKAIFDWRQANA